MLNPGLYNYWIVIILMMTGLYMVIARGNLVKKIIGLNIFQVSVFMLYISMGKIHDGKHKGTAPILKMTKQSVEVSVTPGPVLKARDLQRGRRKLRIQKVQRLGKGPQKSPKQPQIKVVKRPQFHGVTYSNPVPHVLILTAIVVGIATTALGLALVVRIYEAYGTIEEDEIQSQDLEP